MKPGFPSFDWMGLVAAVFATLQTAAHAGGAPPELMGKILPAYEGADDACYVLLKPQVPYYFSSDEEPVCRAVLKNYNRYCDNPPQYIERKIHPSTTDIKAPQWVPLSPEKNFDLVKQLIHPSASEKDQETRWTFELSRLKPLMANGTLKLFRADVVGFEGERSIHTVYRLENLHPEEGADNQAHLLFAEHGERVRSAGFGYYPEYQGELIQHEGSWYVSRFSDVDRRFLVVSVDSRNGLPIRMKGECAIEHKVDRAEPR